MDLGPVDRHGDLQYWPFVALPVPDHDCLVNPRRCLADYQPGGGQLPRGDWRVHHVRSAGDHLRRDRQLRATGQTHPGITGLSPAGRDPVQDLQ